MPPARLGQVESAIDNVGRQLRRMRRARGLTLDQLAERAGCTGSYLSSIENGTAVPSLSAVSTLAAVLGSDVTAFFAKDEAQKVTVFRASDPERLRFSPSRQESFTMLSNRADDPGYNALAYQLYPSITNVKYRYFGERFALVLHGKVQITIGERSYTLGPGDTIHYSSHPEHTLKTLSNEPAELLWIVAPALI
jgi:transcriptional regulator with XRE-family HTH domain